jgi:hypothetical protein
VWRSSTRQSVALGSFSLGLVLGGLTSAIALFTVSPLVQWIHLPSRVILFAAAGISLALHETSILSLPLPETRRQVPRNIFDKQTWRAAIQFGFELGTGVRTYVSVTAPYLLGLSLLLLSDEAGIAIAAGVGFGLGRSAMILGRFWSGNQTIWDQKLERRLRWLPLASLSAVLIGLLTRLAPINP